MKTRTRGTIGATGTKPCTKCPGCTEGPDHKKEHANGNSRRIKGKNRRRPISSSKDVIAPAASTNSSGITEKSNGSTDQANSPSSSSTNTNGSGDSRVNEIMKIDTKNYCLFCYRSCSDSFKRRSAGVKNAEQSTVDPSKKEISSRFLKLLTRYLKLDIYSHINNDQQRDPSQQNFFTKTLKPNENRFEITSCDSCFMVMNSFCELYHQMQHVQIQLDWNVVKLRNIMRCAEKVPSRMTAFRENVLEGRNRMKNEEKMLMDGFKREFFRNSIPKRFPKVALARLEEKEGGNGGTVKQPKTLLVQSLHGMRLHGMGMSTNNHIRGMIRPRPRTIQALKIGQELKLTSRRQPNDSTAVLGERNPAIQRPSVKASPPIGNQVAQTVPSIVKAKPRSKHLVSRPIATKSVPQSPNQVEGSPKKTKTIIKIIKRRIPASTFQQKMPNSLLLKAKLPAQKRHLVSTRRPASDPNPKTGMRKIAILPKTSTPTEGEAGEPQVIDLCESDEEENGNEDASCPIPAKRAKTSNPDIVLAETSICNQSATKPTETGENNGSASQENEVQHHGASIAISPDTPTPPPKTTLPTPNGTEQVSSANSASNHSAETPIMNEIEMNPDNQMFEMSNSSQQMEHHESEYIPEGNFSVTPPTTGQFNNFDAYVPAQTFELPTPSDQPGEEIQVTLDHAVPEASTMITVTHTITSTFSSVSHEMPLDGNFPIRPHTFPTFGSAPVFQPSQETPPYPHEPHSNQQSGVSFENPFEPNQSNDNDMNGSFYNEPEPAVSQDYFHPTFQPIVTEVDDNYPRNSDSSQNIPASQEVGSVEISEVIDESHDCDSNNVETIDDNEDEVIVILQSNVNQPGTDDSVDHNINDNLENNNFRNVQA